MQWLLSQLGPSRNRLTLPLVAAVRPQTAFKLDDDDLTVFLDIPPMLSTQDKTRIDDTRIASVRPLMTPALLEELLPASPAHLALVERSRQDISNVLQGKDDRLVVVVGPCSIHDHDQAIAYAKLLKVEADKHAKDLQIVMRVYFEKPRTTVG